MPDFDIDQINRVRKAMGMPLLPVPGGDGAPVFKDDKDSASPEEEPASTYETREAAAGDNWHRLQAERDAKAKRDAQKAAIKKARDQAQRFAQLEGKGLADDDDDDAQGAGSGKTASARDWLRGQKRRQAELEKARRYEQELADREQQAQYTSADLAGVKVGHQLSQFDDEAGEQILTLKDAAVDAESEDDELENADLRDRERLEERMKSKLKRPAYNPMDDGEGQGNILAQYDEEIEGKKKQRFTLDGQGSTREAMTQLAEGTQKLKGVTISLDILQDDTPISDYKDASEVKIRKPKKGKGKVKKRKADDDDDIVATPVGQDVDMSNSLETGAPTIAKRRRTDDTFVDDEDLQSQLAAQRSAALKKRKKRTPEDIAREIREEASATPGPTDAAADADNEPGMVIDETSEFLANLQVPTREERRRPAARSASRALSIGAEGQSPDEDDAMPDVVKDEEHSDLPARSREHSAPAEITATGLEDEADLNQGIAASLHLLKQRGVIKTSEGGDISAAYREQQRFLAEKHKREEEAERRARLQRERDRTSGRTANMSAKQREDYARQMNVQRDQIESRQMAEIFNREYKPNVELKYTDEYGRSLNQKEAFRHLSHQFHGKGSGKQKTEKTLKKMEDEKRREAMSVLDASQNATNMNSVAGERSKRNRQAGVRLQ